MWPRGLNADRITAVVIMAVMVWYAVDSLQLRKALRSDVIGPSLYPVLVAILGFGLAVILYLRPGEGASEAPDAGQAGAARDLIPWGMLVAYVGLMPLAGFHLATFLFMFATLKLLRQPTWFGAAILSALVAGVAHLVFLTLLDIPLPMGPFGDSY